MTRDTGGGTAVGSETGNKLTVDQELNQGTAKQDTLPRGKKEAACTDTEM